MSENNTRVRLSRNKVISWLGDMERGEPLNVDTTFTKDQIVETFEKELDISNAEAIYLATFSEVCGFFEIASPPGSPQGSPDKDISKHVKYRLPLRSKTLKLAQSKDGQTSFDKAKQFCQNDSERLRGPVLGDYLGSLSTLEFVFSVRFMFEYPERLAKVLEDPAFQATREEAILKAVREEYGRTVNPRQLPDLAQRKIEKRALDLKIFNSETSSEEECLSMFMQMLMISKAEARFLWACVLQFPLLHRLNLQSEGGEKLEHFQILSREETLARTLADDDNTLKKAIEDFEKQTGNPHKKFDKGWKLCLGNLIGVSNVELVFSIRLMLECPWKFFQQGLLEPGDWVGDILEKVKTEYESTLAPSTVPQAQWFSGNLDFWSNYISEHFGVALEDAKSLLEDAKTLKLIVPNNDVPKTENDYKLLDIKSAISLGKGEPTRHHFYFHLRAKDTPFWNLSRKNNQLTVQDMLLALRLLLDASVVSLVTGDNAGLSLSKGSPSEWQEFERRIRAMMLEYPSSEELSKQVKIWDRRLYERAIQSQ